jgi:hypothetical protein
LQIVVGHPPNFDEIKAAFPNAVKNGVLFAYGDTIFNPSNANIPPQLIAHEQVHSRQHVVVGGPSKWWRRYIDDMEFRAAQELAAHCAEYRVYCDRVKDRNLRAKTLHMIASRLAGPLYGNAMSFLEARRAIGENAA